MKISRQKLKKIGITLLVLYLVFDLRPLLLVPNLIICQRPCARYVNSEGSMELSVFPRLCIAGDPIKATIRAHDLPLGEAFSRSYDRSGLFSELEFSGTVNKESPLSTLYWTMCIAGGLGGEINPEKQLWLGDYIRFDKIGVYRIKLRYQDRMDPPASTKIDYDLGDFSVVYLPENPVSKLLKQCFLSSWLLVPSDNVRDLAVKWLGYQETALSTYVLAKYRSHYDAEGPSTKRRYNHSLAETQRGILRNHNYRSVGNILRRVEQPECRALLRSYLYLHLCRFIFAGDNLVQRVPIQVAQQDMARLIACTYPYVDEANRNELRVNLTRLRERETDAYWQKGIATLTQRIGAATNDTERISLESSRKAVAGHLARTEERHERLQLIDYAVTLLDGQDSPKVQGAQGSGSPARSANRP